MSVRNFGVLGQNIYLLSKRILSNNKLCQLLVNTGSRPFDHEPDKNNLLHNNILIVPKLVEEAMQEQKIMNYIVIMLDDFTPDPRNPEFKIATIRFDVICHFENWIIDDASLRPYAIMEELDIMFNGKKLQGIGNLSFAGADRLVVSPYLGGYSLLYSSSEFN